MDTGHAGWRHLKQVDFGPTGIKRLLMKLRYAKGAQGHPTRVAVLVAKTLMPSLKA